jgi:hypothetical protein
VLLSFGKLILFQAAIKKFSRAVRKKSLFTIGNKTLNLAIYPFCSCMGQSIAKPCGKQKMISQ